MKIAINDKNKMLFGHLKWALTDKHDLDRESGSNEHVSGKSNGSKKMPAGKFRLVLGKASCFLFGVEGSMKRNSWRRLEV